MQNYWDYYVDGAECAPAPSERDYIEESRLRLREMGCSPDQIQRLTESGFLAMKDFNILIDRYHGGLLSSVDSRTRYSSTQDTIDDLLHGNTHSQPGCPVFEASSPRQVYSIVSQLEAQSQQRLVFRGQVDHYKLDRDVANPALYHPILGETSLIPSVWRKVLAKHSMCLGEFIPWSLFEWSAILYKSFDVDGVDAAIKASGGNPAVMTTGDMAEHPDPIVREFGEFRRALTMDHSFNLATALSTLLQHYGLLSPVLDVSRDIATALFFATHKYTRNHNQSVYTPVGSNGDQAIIYVLRYSQKEMEPIKQDIVIDRVPPLRPQRQACVVVRSSPFAVNLPADFLVGVVKLHGVGPWDLSTDCRTLFPDDREDSFLKALKTHPQALYHLTDFFSQE